MKVIITSPSEYLEYDAQWLNVTTADGNRVILEGHEPLIAALKPKSTVVLELSDHSKIQRSLVTGIIAIERDTVTIVLGN